MLGLTKPTYFIPMHGEFRMQVQHGRLAIETGVKPENVFIIENGTPIEIWPDGSARRGQPVSRRLRLRRRAVGRRGRRRRAARPAGARQRRHVHGRRPGGQADRHASSAGRRSSRAASSTATRRTRSSRRRSAASARRSTSPGDRISEIALLKSADQGRRVALPVRADQAPADGVPGRGRGLADGDASTHRRLPHLVEPRSQASKSSRGASTSAKLSLGLSPAVVPLADRDRAAGARRRHADRPDAAGPGRPDRLVAQPRGAVLRRRALAAAVRAAPVGLVPRVGPGQGAGCAVGAHAAGHRDVLRRDPRPHPARRVLGRVHRRPHRPVPEQPARAAAHDAGRVRDPHRAHDRRAADRVRHAAARARVARDARGEGRRHDPPGPHHARGRHRGRREGRRREGRRGRRGRRGRGRDGRPRPQGPRPEGPGGRRPGPDRRLGHRQRRRRRSLRRSRTRRPRPRRSRRSARPAVRPRRPMARRARPRSAIRRTSPTPRTRRPAARRSRGSCRRSSCSTSTSRRRPPPAPPRTPSTRGTRRGSSRSSRASTSTPASSAATRAPS